MTRRLIAFLLLFTVLLLFGCQSDEAEIKSSFSIKTSVSPNQKNIIEIQEMSKEDNVGLHASGRPMFHSLRIYYGEYGSLLEDFVVLEEIRMPSIDYFDVVWTDDENVTINVIPRDDTVIDNEVQTYEVETYEFDFATETLSK
ncbi:hypothetical protein [Planococcus sp. CAU13]|uniref:hypothetical protein n=1 Tax=Planococcus sp. CAU13 TaxID=1541197 RepID=UPI00052FF4D8|nr:hypothetical protein [Planococcus sp. CAU13]